MVYVPAPIIKAGDWISCQIKDRREIALVIDPGPLTKRQDLLKFAWGGARVRVWSNRRGVVDIDPYWVRELSNLEQLASAGEKIEDEGLCN